MLLSLLLPVAVLLLGGGVLIGGRAGHILVVFERITEDRP